MGFLSTCGLDKAIPAAAIQEVIGHRFLPFIRGSGFVGGVVACHACIIACIGGWAIARGDYSAILAKIVTAGYRKALYYKHLRQAKFSGDSAKIAPKTWC